MFHHSLYRERKEEGFICQLWSEVLSTAVNSCALKCYMSSSAQRALASPASASARVPQGKSRERSGTGGLAALLGCTHVSESHAHGLPSQQQLEWNKQLSPYSQLLSLAAVSLEAAEDESLLKKQPQSAPWPLCIP